MGNRQALEWEGFPFRLVRLRDKAGMQKTFYTAGESTPMLPSGTAVIPPCLDVSSLNLPAPPGAAFCFPPMGWSQSQTVVG